MERTQARVLASITKSVLSDSGDTITITGYASTVSKDRASDIVPASAWEMPKALGNYMKNPIILFGHDHSKPIGKAVELTPTPAGLQITAEIHRKACGEQLFAAIEAGILKTFSIGFGVYDAEYDYDHDIFILTEIELWEVSVVSVPCNQDSTFEVSKAMTGKDFEQFKEQFKTKAALPEPGNLSNFKTAEELATYLLTGRR